MFENILDFLIVAEFSQALLLSFIILTMKKNKMSNVYLVFFILAPSLMFFSMFLHKNGYIDFLRYFSLISIPSVSLAGVFMFLYTKRLINTESRFVLKDLYHFLIFVILLSVFLIIRDLVAPFERGRVVLYVITIGLANSLFYLIYSSLKLKLYLKQLEDYYSDTDKMNMSWLKLITVLSLVVMVILSGIHLEGFFRVIPMGIHVSLTSISILGFMGIILITAYHVVNMPKIFRINIIMDQDESERPENSAVKEKYARQSLSDENQRDILEKLKIIMGDKKPYLKDNISIKDLSCELDIPSHHLSIVINNKLGKNFYNFINGYRVEDAKNILQDPLSAEVSIISIAYKVGFNSKSTFNTVFKKTTGLTPTQFREESRKRS